jgi:hypothetical protein
MLEEVLLIVAHSRKTQVALTLAFVFPICIWLLGEYMVGGIQFTGPMSPLTDFVRDELMHRYDKVALTAFIGFLGAALASYRRDRRRILEL